jgi:hypothetical protein
MEVKADHMEVKADHMEVKADHKEVVVDLMVAVGMGELEDTEVIHRRSPSLQHGSRVSLNGEKSIFIPFENHFRLKRSRMKRN